MSYAADRFIHDADSHIMDAPNALLEFADLSIRERMSDYSLKRASTGVSDTIDAVEKLRQDPDYVARDDAEIMSRKRYHAVGAMHKEDRPKALDALGFQSQLVFNTFAGRYLYDAEHGDDPDFAYGVARAQSRYNLDFCSVDKRLLSTCYVPLMDFDRTEAYAKEMLDAGAKALLIASACPKNHSPSHSGLYPLWAQAQEAGVPIVFHVGGGGPYFDKTYFYNGSPVLKDWLGGDENFRSVNYMSVPNPVTQTLATLAIDGIMKDFPDLKFGVVEMGCCWIPSFLKFFDSGFEAFRRHEERLQALDMKPSEYIQRQVRVTPYPTEDVGWVMREGGEDMLCFASDYPHIEGGRNPIKRFDTFLEANPVSHQPKFYHANMTDLMGTSLAGFAAAA